MTDGLLLIDATYTCSFRFNIYFFGEVGELLLYVSLLMLQGIQMLFYWIVTRVIIDDCMRLKEYTWMIQVISGNQYFNEVRHIIEETPVSK